jgi:uncharacterized protein with von Willebrand factor type A (vWA) domain
MPVPSQADTPSLLHHVVALGGRLRDNGIAVNPASLVDLCRALELVEWRNREDVRSAARATLVTRREQLSLFERIFDIHWTGLPESPEQEAGPGGNDTKGGASGESETPNPVELQVLSDALESSADRDSHSPGDSAWSNADLLTRKDLGSLDEDELLRARQLLAAMVKALLNRPGRRSRSARRGREVDFRASFRRGLSRGFDGLELRYRQPRPGKLKLLLLCDVSGSMQRYSEFLLQFVYALRGQLPDIEAAVFATHMTPITNQLRAKGVQQSLVAVSSTASGWGGGTDIGQSLLEFNDYYDRQLRRSRAVVVILSDGWDRGDARVMRQEIAGLRRRVHRLLWLNPLLGAADYQPLCRGIRLALPYLDHFLPAHSLASLADVARLLRRFN